MQNNGQTTSQVTVTKIKNLLKENPRLAESLLLHTLNRTRFKNLRQLEVFSGFSSEELEKHGLIETYPRKAFLVMNRLEDETYILSQGSDDIEDARRTLRRALEELEDNGVSMPVSSDSEDLIGDCLSNMGMFDEVAHGVRFEDEGFEGISEQDFSYPMVIRMSKAFKIPDAVKPKLNKALGNLDIDPEFVRKYWEVQQDSDSGIFTAISSKTEGHHRVIYPIARNENLSEAEIGDLLLEMEEEIVRGPFRSIDVEDAVEKIKRESKEEQA